MNLDRFSHGLPDRQQEEPLKECQLCGNELYLNYEAYEFEDGTFACSEECVLEAVGAKSIFIGSD